MRPRCIQFSFFARRFCPIVVVFPLFTFVADCTHCIQFSSPLPAFLLAPSFPVASPSADGTLTAGIIITFSPPTRGRRIEEGRFNYFIAWPATATSVPLPLPLITPPRPVLRDIGHDGTRDVTDVSLISPYWLGCRDAYINFTVRDVKERALLN